MILINYNKFFWRSAICYVNIFNYTSISENILKYQSHEYIPQITHLYRLFLKQFSNRKITLKLLKQNALITRYYLKLLATPLASL